MVHEIRGLPFVITGQQSPRVGGRTMNMHISDGGLMHYPLVCLAMVEMAMGMKDIFDSMKVKAVLAHFLDNAGENWWDVRNPCINHVDRSIAIVTGQCIHNAVRTQFLSVKKDVIEAGYFHD